MKIKTLLLTLSLLFAVSSSFAMKKADFIKAGYTIVSVSESQLVLLDASGNTVIAVAASRFDVREAKDGREYFVLK